jgi:hypothetical protein
MKHQPIEEKINSLSRFILYAGAMLSLSKNTSYYFVVSVMLTIIIAVVSMRMNGKFDRNQKDRRTVTRSTHPEHMQMISERCSVPTKENPFGNVLINEYSDNPGRPPACAYKDVETDINEKFKSGLFTDLEDVYGNENSQRQFFTTPNTEIPNDQINFAKWCYQKDKTCKENPVECTGFEAGN